ncbi:MAG TPA: matrixin family metalloprotease, partial [Bacteroidetes bacterium]|nr:matrixin family metalloprotease [Bacteroidota bacterium]
MTYPVSLEMRESLAQHIVLGKMVAQHSYWDAERANIYTLNIIEVTAWLKGYQAQAEIGVITLGGTLENEAQISHPSLELLPWNEYVLFLKGNEQVVDNRAIRETRPNLIQALPCAAAQGALTKQSGRFHDLHHLAPAKEAGLLAKIEFLTSETALTPTGKKFQPRSGDTFPLSDWAQASTSKTAAITSFAPNPTNSGTIAPADFITINGSAFGAAAGTVFYTNANDGGATFTSSGVATDNLAWSATQIRNKPASNGGTGPININGTQTSAGNLTINYSHIDINSSFSSFAQTTRQRYNLADVNGTGSYQMLANAAFSANAPAVSAFTRATETWRCATGFTVNIGVPLSVAVTVANDNENTLLFDATLPNGVLGRATSRFLASANGACNQTNTVWWLNELDIQFKPNPPSAGTTWNFGPGGSAALQFDFESVALHELGHAHGLGHVISPGAVMHFAIANGIDIRGLSPNDIAGGLNKMAYSTGPYCFTPAAINAPITANMVGCILLPTNDLSLQGSKQSAANLLQWAQDQQQSPTGFYLERSTDGKHFKHLTFIPGQAPGNTETIYSHLDRELPSADQIYYRLRQHDQDGTQHLSNVVAIQSTSTETVQVYPNPVQQHLQLRGKTSLNGPATLQFINVNGQNLKT